MFDLPLETRIDLADRLDELAAEVPREIAAQFLSLPTGDGALERLRVVEDVGSHLHALAGAVTGGRVVKFEEYARWKAHIQAVRGMAPHYVEEQLEVLERTLAHRLNPEAGRWVSLFLEAGCRVCHGAVDSCTSRPDQNGLQQAQVLFMGTLLRGRRKAGLKVVFEAMKAGFPTTQIYRDVVQESLYEIGEMWEGAKITVAQEHAATAVVQYVMSQMCSGQETHRLYRGKIVICGPEKEAHQIGANMAADFFEAAGWDVLFLGTDMPHVGILHAVKEHKADIVGISATILSSVPNVVRLVDNLRWHFGEACPRIVLGGRAFEGLADFGVELGAARVVTRFRDLEAMVKESFVESGAAESADGQGFSKAS